MKWRIHWIDRETGGLYQTDIETDMGISLAEGLTLFNAIFGGGVWIVGIDNEFRPSWK